MGARLLGDGHEVRPPGRVVDQGRVADDGAVGQGGDGGLQVQHLAHRHADAPWRRAASRWARELVDGVW